MRSWPRRSCVGANTSSGTSGGRTGVPAAIQRSQRLRNPRILQRKRPIPGWNQLEEVLSRAAERKPNQAATASVIPVRAGRGPEPPPPTVDASSDAEWREVDAFRPEALRQERDSPPAVVESGDSDA